MASLRVATFNVENLFARWKFNSDVDPDEANERGWIVEAVHFDELGEDDKRITGKAVKEVKADVIAFQEVEGVDTLKHFRTDHLDGFHSYEHVAGIDGNDQRLIDVAVLSKHPIVHVRSYAQRRDTNGSGKELFSRDCLEVDVDVEGTPLTLFVNHFKSMIRTREETRPKRERQAAGVRKIVEDRFGPNPGDENFVVVGDLNDYLETDEQGESGIKDLVEWDQVENVVARLPAEEQWTHFFSKRKDYKQLDYMLLSKSLAEANPGKPEIMRKGCPKRAVKYPGERFDGVGEDDPKASDHCPVVMEIELP
ncbi:MAG TPA: endonuclease/exonuclease/phosphatase family protein [Solirubrobacterales bacterium]|nr:endonuclease/exonuclease/phosphatase family protein [Solirubrobacterales bacterium]